MHSIIAMGVVRVDSWPYAAPSAVAICQGARFKEVSVCRGSVFEPQGGKLPGSTYMESSSSLHAVQCITGYIKYRQKFTVDP